jgi:rubredoxin
MIPRIIGYSFNSAICCPTCTKVAFEVVEELIQPCQPNNPDYDEHGLPTNLTNTNREPVRPIFSTDDYPDGITCDECGAQIP